MKNAKFMDVDGIRTRYFEGGAGEPVVLIHGGGFGQYSNAYDWSSAFDALCERFHVYAPDKIGAGHTDNPETDEGYTMTRTVRHVHDFLLAAGLERAVLVGHSRGGLAAARIAVDHPEMTKALVIVDSQTLAPDHPSTPRDFYVKLAANAPAIPDAAYVRREIEANSYTYDHITPDLVEERLATALLPKVQTAKEKMRLLYSARFLPDVRKVKYETLDLIRDGHLKAPTLVVWGLNDPSAPVILGYQLHERLAFGVPNTELHVFNSAGHYPHRERRVEFERVVAGFILTAT